MKIEYGAMSSRYSIEANNKLSCYAGMVLHFGGNANLIAIYSPEECRADSWLMASPLEERLNEIFGGGERAFFNYLDNHTEEVYAACDTIKTIL